MLHKSGASSVLKDTCVAREEIRDRKGKCRFNRKVGKGYVLRC